MEALLPLIEKTFPIPARFRRALPRDVAELSRLLTSGRGGRSLSYLNHPPALSAYLRYFLPWNVYRLCRLLPALDLPLSPGDWILDLGSGPLTLPIALWLCRPELRALPLEFRCLDRSRAALDAGRKLFAALAASGIPAPPSPRPLSSAAPLNTAPSSAPPVVPPSPWTFTVLSGEIAQVLRGGKLGEGGNPALIAALNVYNEIFQPIPPGSDEGLARLAELQAALLAASAGGKGRILVVEPGIPRSGRFITLLRAALMDRGFPPRSPCAHHGPCPFPGLEKHAGAAEPRGPQRRPPRRPPGPAALPPSRGAEALRDTAIPAPEKAAAKWCHFAFDAQDAPAALRRLSAEVGLPKDRATLSFLLAGPPAEGKSPPLPASPGAEVPLRIISDPFPLGGQEEWGRYGCAEQGIVLLRAEAGRLKSLPPGILVTALSTGRRDPKSGAPLCRLP
jgi:hypothetical protein